MNAIFLAIPISTLLILLTNYKLTRRFSNRFLSYVFNRERGWLPQITKETHLVIGHLHQRFYNERIRVYGLGHWTSKGSKYHQKCYLKLDSTSTVDCLTLTQFENQLHSSQKR